MKPETNYAKSGDVYIAYQVNGTGPFDLVWAPGTFSHLDMDWEFPMRADFFLKLGTICRLIRFDKRGTGLSDRPTHMATLEQRTDDIRAVMDAAGSERAVIFGGSEGASMARLGGYKLPTTPGGSRKWSIANSLRTAATTGPRSGTSAAPARVKRTFSKS